MPIRKRKRGADANRKIAKRMSVRGPAPTLPSVLYVVRDDSAPDLYLGTEDFDGFDDGAIVGIFHLHESRTLTVTRGLRPIDTKGKRR